MKRRNKIILLLVAVTIVWLFVSNPERDPQDPLPLSLSTPVISRTSPIIIGIEYAVKGQDAAAFAALEISAVKPLPESLNWSRMQPNLSDPIDYETSDRFIREYQNVGFNEIVMGLRTLSHAQDNGATYGKNRPVPKPEYTDAYIAWIAGVVERYDMDGLEDMPDLKKPVRYYEIEVEFSSYTPESTDEYLEKLRVAYQAAHAAYQDVLVAHSAFLALTAFDANPTPTEYEQAFASMRIPDKTHDLKDMRAILDHPESFDLINFHELGDPIMIERTVAWLRYETQKRGYTKPIIISDTTPTPFISYGRATACTGPFLGVVLWPARESDRCRLADYFNKILDADVETIAWKNKFIAADMVKKTIIAAAQGVELINTSFTADLPILNSKLGFAAAGNAGFGGIVSEQFNFFTKKYTITEYRPGYFALQQLARQLRNAETIVREPSDETVRLYKIETLDGVSWIGWVHPNHLLLPGDNEPTISVSLSLPSGAVTTEMATTKNAPQTLRVENEGSTTNILLTTTPLYITELIP